MPRYAFETFDVFTDRRFAGNPLAVVMDARGLDDAAMQTITREFNYAESTFVFPPQDRNNAARVRIFTQAYEMAFAGHPTVGTAIALARARGLEGEIRLELNTGVFPVRIGAADGLWSAEFVNPNLPAERGTAPEPAALEAALSLPRGAVATGAHRPRRIGAGVDFYYVRAPLAAVRNAKLDAAAAERLDFAGVIGVLLYAEGGDRPDTDYHVRMFAPEAGVAEDPATGSAAAALPGQLARAGALKDGGCALRIEQGVELGRPSLIRVAVDVARGEVARVAVGGNAVPVARGEIEV
jgi:trans-2,3-dihydro-3-hydroxyanthranilate isomerase